MWMIQDTRLEKVLAFFIYASILVSPLPFASSPLVWRWFWVVLTSIVFCFSLGNLRYLPFLKISTAWAISFLLACIYILLQWLGQIVDIDSTQLWVFKVAEYKTFSSYDSVSRVAAFWGQNILYFTMVLYAVYSKAINPHVLVRFIGVTCFLYSIYGLIGYFSGNEYILWYEKWASRDSLSATFVNRNSFAAYAGLGAQCLCFWVFQKYLKIDSNPFCQKPVLEKVIELFPYIVGLMAVLTALILSNSRAGVITSLIGILFLLKFTFRLDDRSYSLAAIPIVFVVGTILVVLMISGDILSSRILDSLDDDPRFYAYQSTLCALKEQPILGFGLGSFEQVFPIFRNEGLHLHLVRAHSDFLEFILYTGLVGFVFLAFSTVWLFGRIRMMLKETDRTIVAFSALLIGVLVQIILHSVLDFPLQVPAVSMTFLAIVAVCFSSAKLKRI